MMYYTLLLVSLVFTAHAASIREGRSHGRVVGGHDAKIEDFPYQVSLQYEGEHWCGGSIISKNYILTAVHCLRFPTAEYTVRSGSSYHAEGGHIHKVVEKIFYDDDLDIAIAKVNPPFKFDKTQQPIKVADVKAKIGSLANVTGWGKTLEHGTTPDKLQVVEVPMISEKECSEAYQLEIPEHEVCAGYLGVGGKDTCQGDSGGPLVVDGHQVGVVSWGFGCARPESPGVYVNVAHFRKWIKTQTRV